MNVPNYNPKSHSLMTFHDTIERFRDGTDTPRNYLERCLDKIDAIENTVMAWEIINTDAAREAADEAGQRYREGKTLSLVDGMPVGIKDLIETVDMPTEFGSVLFKGHQPIRDAASVNALRKGGAVILGKTVTITFGGGDPARTRNPHDPSRTPGGSSSGTAAAVGGGTIPGAIGTHARGSTIRPASFCGAYGLKATYGAINRQGVFSAADSMDHLGVFGGSLSDVWIMARHMAKLGGGDPGYPGLYGGDNPPSPRKPVRLIRLETAGWNQTDDATKAEFDRLVRTLADAGVEIFGRNDDPSIEAYENVFAEMPDLWRSLYRFEFQWPMLQYKERYPDQVPPRLLMGLKEAEGLTQAEYREALNRRVRARDLHRQLKLRADAFITLSSPGPAPVGMDQGSAVFNEGSSVIGMPSLSLPLLEVENVPVGVQLLGQFDEDESLTAIGRWIAEEHFGI
ncbi:MAG: amidase [Pseudomonadota bacterium]|nr:amidase [Pseudomonadota bacterium]